MCIDTIFYEYLKWTKYGWYKLSPSEHVKTVTMVANTVIPYLYDLMIERKIKWQGIKNSKTLPLKDCENGDKLYEFYKVTKIHLQCSS